jgi:hypothetical protein
VSRTGSTDSNAHPDLNEEVATLSTKLVNAINHQTNLDDTLQHTRHELESTRAELETAKARLAQLEAADKEHRELIEKGWVVEKEVYDKMEKQLLSELAEEKKRRIDAEKAKRKVDAEVEALTTALFEEANGMVAAARKETEATEKRNEQLKQQLCDTELLLASQQEQLQDLKTVMQQMSSDRDENETGTAGTYSTTAPSTPGLVPADRMNKLFEANLTPNTPGSEEVPPDHPLHFAHLIRPVLRNDLPTYREFQDMFKISHRSSAPPSRVASANYGSLNILGLNSLTGNNSTTSLPNGSLSSSPRESVTSPPLPLNLKEDKFYKRALVEDIEPTLRLDLAPGVSWMARRVVMNSMTAGSLVVEPHPPVPKFRGPVFPCALCGEARKGEQYARKFRFKTTESDEAQKYPLCDYCLGRVRATCNYIGFLRMVAAGHWRAESEDDKKSAWEESVRLRERMFWARIGGGVVPAFIPLRESPRSPVFVNGMGKPMRSSEESQLYERGLDSAIAMMDAKSEPKKSEEDPFRSRAGKTGRPVSIGNTVISAEPTPSLSPDEEKRIEHAVETQLQNEIRKSLTLKLGNGESAVEIDGERDSKHLRPKSTPGPSPHRAEKEKRLSLTIPGSFE